MSYVPGVTLSGHSHGSVAWQADWLLNLSFLFPDDTLSDRHSYESSLNRLLWSSQLARGSSFYLDLALFEWNLLHLDLGLDPTSYSTILGLYSSLSGPCQYVFWSSSRLAKEWKMQKSFIARAVSFSRFLTILRRKTSSGLYWES